MLADAVATITAYDGDVTYDDAGRPLNSLVWCREFHNLIVTSGKTLMLQRLSGVAANAVTVIGVGTDSTAAAVGQTQLNPSVTGSVLLQTVDATFPSVAGTTATWQATYGTGVANFSWNECGLFNGTTNGTSTMFDRIVIGPFAKTTAVSIVIQIQIVQS